MKDLAAIPEVRAQLENIMAADAAWCRKRLSEIHRRLQRGQATERMANQVIERVHRSRSQVDARREALPRPVYDDQSPDYRAPR